MSLKFQQFLQDWFQSSSGSALLKQEQVLVARAVSNLFGFYLVQLGAAYPPPDALLATSRVKNKVLLDEVQTVYSQVFYIKGDLDYLPFKKEGVDVVFMPHTLETVQDPYHLLRQVDRILLPEGHMVITGFNPFGCALLRQRWSSNSQAFKDAHLMKMDRVIDWLNLLGYDIEMAAYSPVSCLGFGQMGRLMARFGLGLEKIGLNLGNVYCIVGRKRIDSPKPVGLNWRLANWLPVNKGVSVSPQRTQEQHCDK